MRVPLEYPRGWSLTARAALIATLTVLIVATSVLTSVAVSTRRAADEAARHGLDQSADLVAQFLAGRERTLVGGARVFAQAPLFRTLVAERRHDDVLDQAIEAADQIGADWVFITDENGVLIAKSDEVAVTNVSMGQVPLIADALRGQVKSGFGASGDTMLFQAVAVPISARLGAPAGVLVAARVVDSVFLHDGKAVTSSDLLFYSRDEKGRAHATAATIRAPAAELAAFVDSPTQSRQSSSRVNQLNGINYLSRGSSLNTAGGDIVGGFIVLRARENVLATYSALGMPTLIALLCGALCVLLVTTLTSRHVTRPARQLFNAVTRAEGGGIDGATRPRVKLDGVVEIRDLSTAFANLVTDLRDKEALIAAARVDRTSLDVRSDASFDGGTPSRGLRTIGGKTVGVRAPVLRPISRPGLVLENGAWLSNRYFIQNEVGRGGLGIVYCALDRVVGEVVAIKVLRPELVMADGTSLEKLKLELRITRKLSHRNIVRTHDIGETEVAPYLTMEYVHGASLGTIIEARGSLSRAAILAIAKQLLGALAVAHEHDIVHGDVKPQNLLIDANGLLKVTDFGVARFVRGVRAVAESNADNVTHAAGRLSGAVVGTPQYMAPEQLIGEASTVKSDIYAAGVVLLECMTGTTPYGADTPVAFVARKLGNEHQQTLGDVHGVVSRAHHDIAALVERMTDAQFDRRAASARELLYRFSELD